MPWDQQRYEALRLELIDRNEARVDNVYLDTLGIPTVGLGVALTARQRDRSMHVDQGQVDALVDVINLDPAHREQLNELLIDYSRVQNRHVDERFRNLSDFQRSQFGQEAQEVLGPTTNTRHDGPNGAFYSWDVLTNHQSPLQLSLTHEQSLELFQQIAPDYENRLDRILQRADCPAEALSEEQRAALYSMTYHGATGKASRVAEPIGQYWRGEISEEELQTELRRAVRDPNFLQRSANELELLQNIETRPVRELEAPEQPQQAHAVTRSPDEQERRRMIDDDRDRRNDTQFPGPGTELPDWDEVQARENPQAFTTGDPDLDKLAAALFANDEAAISRMSAQIEQSPQVQSFEQWGRDLVATHQREELQQQEMARQMQGPLMRM